MTLTTPGLYPAEHAPGGGAALAAPPRTHERAFPARPDQVGEARRFLAAVLGGAPVAEDAATTTACTDSGSCVSSPPSWG